MEQLVLHPQTKAELTALLSDPPHALLLTGANGQGKVTLAKAWACQLADHAAITVLEPDEKGTISIDSARSLYQRTRSKHPGRQVVVIGQANAMSAEAQNALLKLLEEPRPGLIFVLTAPDTATLLPTILSRVQQVRVQLVGTQILTELAKKQKPGISPQELQQLLFVANGRPAALTAMLNDAATFNHYKLIMQRAKQLLATPRYERLAMVQELAKDKTQLVAILEAMAHMLMLHIRRQPAPEQLELADTLQLTLQRLRQNGNLRAQLVHLFMSY